jgi:hypothetical protein
VNRRAFLRLGTFGPALLTLEGLAFGPPAARAEARPAGEILDPGLREILGAITERMVDTGEAGAPSVAEVGAIERIEQLLAVLDRELVRSVKLLLRIVDLWPAVMELRFRRFRSLSDAEKDESLEGWLTSRIALRRQIFFGLRNLAQYGYWTDEATWRLVGYPGPMIGRRA